MYLNIINYTVRIAIIIIGIIILSGKITPKGNEELYQIMGVIFILFGIYRIVLYKMKSKQYDFRTKSMIEKDKEAEKNEI